MRLSNVEKEIARHLILFDNQSALVAVNAKLNPEAFNLNGGHMVGPFSFSHGEKVELYSNAEDAISYASSVLSTIVKLQDHELISKRIIPQSNPKISAFIKAEPSPSFSHTLYSIFSELNGIIISLSVDYKDFIDSGFLTHEEVKEIEEKKEAKERLNSEIELAKLQIQQQRKYSTISTYVATISIIASMIASIGTCSYNAKYYNNERKVEITKMPKGIDTVYIENESKHKDSTSHFNAKSK